MSYEPEIDWSKNTGMMLGRFQPWNAGHRAMFEPPSRVDFTINTHYNDEQIEDLARQIINKLRK